MTELAVVGIAEHPGIAERGREDDLVDQRVDDAVAALVLLQLDLGLGRLEELHGAVGNYVNVSFAMLPACREDRRNPSCPVCPDSRSIIGLNPYRAQWH